MAVSWFDIVVIIILLWATFKGASRGLVSQLAWIIALVACFAFAESISVQLAPKIREMFPQVEPPLDRWIAMFVLYMGFAFLSFALARVLRGWLEKAKFEDFDKHLGGILGFVKGIIICIVLTFFAVTLSDSMRDTILKSHSGHAAAVIMQTLKPVMPKELPTVITNAMERLKDPDFHPDGDADHGFLDDVLNIGGEQGDANNGVAGGEQGKDGGFFDDLLNFGKGGDAPTTPDINNQANTQPSNNQSMTLNDFIRQLPSNIGNDIKSSALEALQNSTAEQKQQLIEKISQLQSSANNSASDRANQLSGLLQSFAGTFGSATGQSGGDPGFGSGSTPATPIRPADHQQTVSAFLTKIGRIYSRRPEQQQSFINNIQSKLTGVPERVKASVLQDWFADLMPGEDDPDPETGLRTQLEIRILRQLQAAGISPTRLSNELQQRLNAATRQ